MKMLRVCLLLMLVVLLPWRGAVAAAMLCPPATMPASHGTHQMQGTAAPADDPAHAHPAQDDPHGHHDHAQHMADSAQGHDTPTPSTDGKCQLCAATCALSTLPSPAPDLPQPPAAAASAFPALVAPAPDFLSSGQERPPRSI